MEQKCFNCKSFWSGKCHNKDFKKMLGVDMQDEFVYLTEQGELSEYIRENSDNGYEIANIVLSTLKNKGYIKKNRKEITSYEDIDDDEFFVNFEEIMDSMISNFVIPRLKNVEVNFDVDPEFCCKFWE